MAATQAVKKPAGGAFGQFLNANRASLGERAEKEGLKGFSAVSKVASQAWKELSDADKAPYEAKFKEAQAAYEAYRKSDSFVPPTKKAKKGKKEGKKAKKDKDAPKKPVGGAFGIFSNEKRADFVKAAEEKGEKGFGAVAKLTSAAWKALSEEERKPYAEKFTKAMAEYKEVFAAYKAKKSTEEPAVGEEEPVGKGKRGKKEKRDPEAPKRPAGGAYGIFCGEKRDEFKKVADAKGEKSLGYVAKLMSAAWKELSAEAKKPFEERFVKASEEYQVAMKAYREKKGAEEPKVAAPSPSKKASPKKGARKANGETPQKRAAKTAEVSPQKASAPAAKRGRAAAKTQEVVKGVEVSPELLAAAEKEGFRSALENLAKRPEIVEKKCDAAQLVEALKAAGGLVNKAKAALLAA